MPIPDEPAHDPASPARLSPTPAELHQLLINAVRDYALFVLDPTGHVATWNPGAERLKGYTAQEIIGRNFSLFYLPEEVAAGKPVRLLQVAAREGRVEDEGWRVRKDGARFWASVVITALHDDTGHLVGFAKITRDLTERYARETQARALEAEIAARAAAERRRAEVEQLAAQLQEQAVELEAQAAELQEQTVELEAANADLQGALRDTEDARERALQAEARYRLLFDASPLPMWVYDRDTLRFLAVNLAATAQYGYSRDEFLAMTIADIRPPEDIPGLRQAVIDAPPGLRRLSGWRHRRKDGSMLDVEIAGHRIEFDGHDAQLVLVHDVTQRNRAEARLREATDVLRAVVDDSPLAIVVLDRDLRITRWNPAAERLLGWTAAEMLGQSYATMLPDEESGGAAVWHRREEILHGHTVTNLETKRRRKDGTLIEVSLSVAALRNPQGDVRGFAVIVIDVTEQHRLEQQFRQAQKFEAVGLLAGGIAHDFNNLLTVVRSYGYLLREQLESEQMRADAHEILLATDRGAALTRQLLAFSRQQLLTPQTFDVNAVLATAEPFLRRLLPEDIALACVTGRDEGLITADPGQLEQVLMNLVVNARDAMPRGGTLTIATSNLITDEPFAYPHGLMRSGAYVVVRVTDTGEGMDEATRQRVFEPFFTTKGPDRGTGLGLSTVYGIVRQCGGHIWIDSTPGRGTTVAMAFPQAADDLQAGPRDRPDDGDSISRSRAPHTATILACEDELPIRRLLREILEHQGYTVLVARHGRDALQLAAEHEGVIDLLITDVVMPEMGGRQLAEALVATRPGIRVLYISGYTDDVILHRGDLHPRRVLLLKPFHADELLRAVRTMLAI
ncbi:MAG TPA: PAS domain S-box protein [Gemmatimonadaceae bacterium]|nr:PAS domain S-box protein [Gemmatimonadaceae bacterium]